ncbi:hypothetical protein ACB094_05G189800 [Castanea mollissima]
MVFYVEYMQKLKKFKNVLSNLVEDPLEGLNTVDAILRFGIKYHFQEEIETILKRQYVIFKAHEGYDHALHEVALRFRLLRQEGYHVSADVLNKFKNMEGKFKLELGEDIRGLMELYEASEVNVEEEDILDEAKAFGHHLLEAKVKNLDHQRARLILNRMEHPYHKSLPRVLAKGFQENLEGTKDWIKHLQELAKMDLKILKLAKNQPLKWYMWTTACLTDPSLSDQRNTTEQLLDSLKICFIALNGITSKISYKVYKKNGRNPIDSLKKWKRLCNAFLLEAQWFASGNLSKAEEYLKNALVSTGLHVVLVHMFFLLGQGIVKETVNLLDNSPSIKKQLLGYGMKLEVPRIRIKIDTMDPTLSATGKNIKASVEDAQRHVIKMISNTWKQLNKDCFTPYLFPASFIKASLNTARMVPMIYSYDNNPFQIQNLVKYMKSFSFYEV